MSIFQVALMENYGNKFLFFCGGSLIDETHILTAAHCIRQFDRHEVNKVRVRLGDHNIRDGNNDGTSVERRVKRITRHKKFHPIYLWNDVAILTLDRRVEYNTNIQPISLASGNQSYVNNTMTVTGWGLLGEDDWRKPAELMKAKVKVWENGECERSYGSRADPGGILDHMLCASGDGTDSCNVSLFILINTFRQFPLFRETLVVRCFTVLVTSASRSAS